MEVLDFMSKYFWVVAIALTMLNLFIFSLRSKKHIKVNPELKEGYARIFRSYFIWRNIPWLIMGLGCTLGGLSVWYFFRPKEINIYVTAFFVSIIILWIIGTIWLFFQGGAEMLARHPGAPIMNFWLKIKELKSTTTIKIIWILMFVAVLLVIGFLLFSNFRMPNF